MSIGIFYGSSTCYTEMAAEKIRGVLAGKLPNNQVDLHNIADYSSEELIALLEHYSHLILGIPTWDYGELQEDWDAIWDDLPQGDFNGKKVAVFGLGDQVGYPLWFQDALGYLYHHIKALGANMAGHWPNQGYEYEKSQALTPDGQYFVGLPLDDENEAEKSQDRIEGWCEQVIGEFSL